MIEALITALSAEFDGEVIFAPWVPIAITPPAVYVTPGDPWITPSTHGGVEEMWRILCAISVSEPRTTLLEARDLSLRIRRVAMGLGAWWQQTEAPDRTLQTAQAVTAATTIRFKYRPSEE